MKIKINLLPVVLALAGAFTVSSQAEVIKIAHIDPFTGPAAGINQGNVNMLAYAVDLANRNGLAGANNSFEVVAFDNKGSPQETLLQLKNATDQGIHYVIQGLSSAVGLALIDAVNRNNERQPGKEVIYLNATNTAPEMTNEKCSYWHFRFDSNQDMKITALTAYMAKDKSLKKIYLINQNYAMGQQTSVAAKNDLKRLRPDIEIVGDDLHPMLAVKDFAPYIAKIKASGADAVVTANWSADLTLMVKAAKDASLKLPFYTVNAATTGIPAAMAAAGFDNVKLVTYWTPNDDLKASKILVDPFKAKYNDDFTNLPWYTAIRMLSQAIKDAKSSDPVAVARALENVRITSINGELQMRKLDHQVQQPLVIASWTKTNGKDVTYDLEKTGFGFKTIEKVEPYVSSLPTSCQMKRPG
jgi:branched-chain amino acid transport system substrate-binding protein